MSKASEYMNRWQEIKAHEESMKIARNDLLAERSTLILKTASGAHSLQFCVTNAGTLGTGGGLSLLPAEAIRLALWILAQFGEGAGERGG